MAFSNHPARSGFNNAKSELTRIIRVAFQLPKDHAFEIQYHEFSVCLGRSRPDKTFNYTPVNKPYFHRDARKPEPQYVPIFKGDGSQDRESVRLPVPTVVFGIPLDREPEDWDLVHETLTFSYIDTDILSAEIRCQFAFLLIKTDDIRERRWFLCPREYLSKPASQALQLRPDYMWYLFPPELTFESLRDISKTLGARVATPVLDGYREATRDVIRNGEGPLRFTWCFTVGKRSRSAQSYTAVLDIQLVFPSDEKRKVFLAPRADKSCPDPGLQYLTELKLNAKGELPNLAWLDLLECNYFYCVEGESVWTEARHNHPRYTQPARYIYLQNQGSGRGRYCAYRDATKQWGFMPHPPPDIFISSSEYEEVEPPEAWLNHSGSSRHS
ncbi:hypothetical protein F5Y16DRAFT_402875 [Xylariaceae sp. FL0255]|nr:hypothetical protein F5Y16DRAFT_402875 [Xylariaceae sp. FL0255]